MISIYFERKTHIFLLENYKYSIYTVFKKMLFARGNTRRSNVYCQMYYKLFFNVMHDTYMSFDPECAMYTFYNYVFIYSVIEGWGVK